VPLLQKVMQAMPQLRVPLVEAIRLLTFIPQFGFDFERPQRQLGLPLAASPVS